MQISILALIGLLAAAIGLGIAIGWNNSKASVKALADAEIGKATGAAAQALSNFKGKL